MFQKFWETKFSATAEDHEAAHNSLSNWNRMDSAKSSFFFFCLPFPFASFPYLMLSCNIARGFWYSSNSSSLVYPFRNADAGLLPHSLELAASPIHNLTKLVGGRQYDTGGTQAMAMSSRLISSSPSFFLSFITCTNCPCIVYNQKLSGSQLSEQCLHAIFM